MRSHLLHAISVTVNVFAGQPCYDNTVYRRDLGKRKGQVNVFDLDDAGFRNHDIELSESELLANIHKSQDICVLKPRLFMHVGGKACKANEAKSNLFDFISEPKLRTP